MYGMNKLQLKLTRHETESLLRVLEHAVNPDAPRPSPAEAERLRAWVYHRYTRYWGSLALTPARAGGDDAD